MPSAEARHQLNITVSGAVYRNLERLATAAGERPSAYAGALFHAAYTARVKPPTGDQDLDKVVGMVGVLWAEKREPDVIAAALGLSVATVKRIVKAWQAQVRGAAA